MVVVTLIKRKVVVFVVTIIIQRKAVVVFTIIQRKVLEKFSPKEVVTGIMKIKKKTKQANLTIRYYLQLVLGESKHFYNVTPFLR